VLGGARAALPHSRQLLSPRPCQAHILAVENQAARIGDMRRFHRENNVVAGAFDRAGAGITKAVFEFEGERLFAGNLCRALTFRGGAVGIVVSRIEGNLDGAARLFDRQLEDGFPAQEILIRVLSGPAGIGRVKSETSEDRERRSEQAGRKKFHVDNMRRTAF